MSATTKAKEYAEGFLKIDSVIAKIAYEQGYNDRTSEYGGVTPEQIKEIISHLEDIANYSISTFDRIEAKTLLQSLTPKQ